MNENTERNSVSLVLRRMVDLGVIPLENARGNPDIDPKKNFYRNSYSSDKKKES